MNKLTINRKIAILAGIPMAIFIAFAMSHVWEKKIQLDTAETMYLNAKLIKSASDLITQLQRERGQSNLFINGAIGEADIAGQRKQTDTVQGPFRQALDVARLPVQAKEAARKALSRWPQLRADVDRKIPMDQSFKNYTEAVTAIISIQREAIRSKTEGRMGTKLTNLALFEEAKENAAKLRGLMSGLLAANRALSEDQFNSVTTFYSRIAASLESPALSVSPEVAQQIEALRKSPPWIEVVSVFNKVVRNADRGELGIDPKSFFNNATKLVEDIHALGQKELEGIEKAATGIRAEATVSIRWSLGLLLFVVAAMGSLSLVIGRSISRPVAAVAKDLSDASEQVATASSEVASASQQLAEGASEQAAAVEQTSASIEEMSSMTRQNADNANLANKLMKDSYDVVMEAKESMSGLAHSMDEISAASEKTFTIVKSIDEIAFQTNLLALNAAVEAARAGEVGAGFAVVADEVRNLAMRAAEAARNTADLIEGIVARIKGGADLVSQTHTAFGKVAESSSKVLDLVGEITSASNEQALGIQELNQGMSEMDKVIQQNAAVAEESASASAELNVQTLHLKRFVDTLVGLVNRNRPGAEHTPRLG
jgi:methyl-accepting chemotaxis protein